ncbi:MAG: hypothetical protein J7L54_01210 [Elusimicrobia bacterium]|nr:hypothetical protein [Elusimicrobiota bacterium]
MERLQKIFRNPKVSVYRIAPRVSVERFVVSTDETAEILNKPEICGFEYVSNLRKGLENLLSSSFGRKFFSRFRDGEISVLHFLRGGLNFGLLELFYGAFGFSRINASFMTSQRFKKGGRWMIKHDQYRKFALEGVKTIIAADVIATGTTLKNGFDYLLGETRGKFENFVFFTIGTPYAEKIISEYCEKFRKRNRKFSAAVFYLEGRFNLVGEKKTFPFGIPGTDLVKKDALLAPEFEMSQTTAALFERCVIYDVGARAFNWRKHFEDVLDYWKQLSRSGISAEEIYRRKWNVPTDFQNFVREKERKWHAVGGNFLKKLYGREKNRWSRIKKTDAREFCLARIKYLKKSAGKNKRVKGGLCSKTKE